MDITLTYAAPTLLMANTSSQLLLIALALPLATAADTLSQWQSCATTQDRLSRHPDLPFDVPSTSSSTPTATATPCIYAKTCPASCSSPGNACATVCGPPYTGGACNCQSTPGCGSRCQSCPDCSQCCCQPPHHLLEIDTTTTYQTIEGFGGAFTEAAALNFHSLNVSDQNLVLDAYFGAPFGGDGGEGGHGYQLGRIPINSCDFSPAQFSYDDVPNDGPALPHFDHTVAHDAKYVIPFVLRAQARAARAAAQHGGDGGEENGDGGNGGESSGNVLRLFGSPWSPPAWMKNPGGNRPNSTSMSGSDFKQGLATDQQEAWANYLSDWVSAFQKHGVNMWGITVQNEAGK